MAGSGAKILFGLEKALENFLRTVCDDYSLPYEELYERYFIPKPGPEFEATSSADLPEASESAMVARTTATAVTKKPRAKPSSSGTTANTANPNRKPCAGLTTKKTACKKFALDGFDFCACHLPKDPSEVASGSKSKSKSNPTNLDDDMVTPEASAGKKKTGKSKAKAPDAPSKKTKSFPTHSHEPDNDVESQCELCAESGDSAPGSTRKKLEYDLEDDVKTRLSAILSQIDEAGSDSDATQDDDE